METRPRHDHLVAAVRWSVFSVGWALLVAGASLAAGVAAHSTALVGFGLSSLVDGTASGFLVQRFRHERLGVWPADELERRAALAVGAILVGIGLYLAARGSAALAEEAGPKPSALGVALTSASMFVLPVLARMKWRLARCLGSQALRADAVLSGAGGALAAAALTGLVLNTTLDWWWADSVAALLIAATLLREGGLTVRKARRRPPADRRRAGGGRA